MGQAGESVSGVLFFREVAGLGVLGSSCGKSEEGGETLTWEVMVLL